jgi:hypothetical protein
MLWSWRCLLFCCDRRLLPSLCTMRVTQSSSIESTKASSLSTLCRDVSSPNDILSLSPSRTNAQTMFVSLNAPFALKRGDPQRRMSVPAGPCPHPNVVNDLAPLMRTNMEMRGIRLVPAAPRSPSRHGRRTRRMDNHAWGVGRRPFITHREASLGHCTETISDAAIE